MTDSPWSHIRAVRSEPGHWEDFSIEREPTCLVIHATRYALSAQAPLPTDVDTIIIADQLSVDGYITTNGRNVTIAARQVFCSAPSVLDCSGQHGEANSTRAPDGPVAGADGRDGAAGAQGQNGGRIRLVAFEISGPLTIRSLGGNGAKGQQGGNGAGGQMGAPGYDASQESPVPGIGDDGGKGGTAGSGGPGGTGGDSGPIVVRWVKQNTSKIECAPGEGGPVGDPGQPGPGGPGGPPGNNCFDFIEIGPRGEQLGGHTCVNPGQRGSSGPVGDPALPKFQAGTGGALIPTDAQAAASASEIGEFFPLTQLYMTLSDCELRFVNKQYDGLRETLSFLRDIAQALDSGDTYDHELRDRMGGGPRVASNQEWNAFSERVSVLLNRFERGLDAFGYPPNYVSHLNRDLLDGEADFRIKTAKTIEDAYDKYKGAQDDAAVQLAALRASLDSTNNSILKKTKEASDASAAANDCQDKIAKANADVEQLKVSIFEADTAFKNAIQARTPGCTVVEVVEFVGGVIAVVAGFAAGYAAIADSLANLNNKFPQDKDFIEQMKFIRDTFKNSDINTNLHAMQAGYGEIKDAIKNKNVKLVVSLESFEQQLQQYLAMGEAVKYRDVLRTFVAACQARNTLQLDYTKWMIAAVEAKAQADSLKLEAARIEESISLYNNPALAQCTIYLENYLRDSKRRIIEILELERRALSYLTLTTIEPTYSWGTVEQLAKAREDLHAQWINWLQIRGGEELSFQAEFAIERERFPDLFKKLQASKPITFAIPPDHRDFNSGRTSFVTVSEVALSIPGIASKTSRFTCRLTHAGNPIAFNQQRVRFNFVHTERPTILWYKKVGANWQPSSQDDIRNNLRGSPDKYIYLSPFAGWMMEFDQDDKVDFSKVTKIVLQFRAHAVPASAVAVPDFLLQMKSRLISSMAM